MQTFLIFLHLLAVLTLLTGAVYPALVWAVGKTFFPRQAEGSLVVREGRVIGSALLAQKNDDPRYFQSRPSAADFATVPSGASNLAWTSDKLRARLAESAARPPALATTSGSGLDPHLPVEAVRAQLNRVIAARGWSDVERVRCEAWIAAHTEGGTLGPAYVNVLKLNLALDTFASAHP
jgi:K+-transporting ATPase ATPase C chain